MRIDFNHVGIASGRISFNILLLYDMIMFTENICIFIDCTYIEIVTEKMADVSALEHIVEKLLFQNSINCDDTIRNCNLLDIVHVSGKSEILKEMKRIQTLKIETHRRLISICLAQKIKQTKTIHRSSKVRVTTSL